jgi:uncharacterized protein DUF4177
MLSETATAWEYKIEVIHKDQMNQTDTLQTDLSMNGMAGWELVSIFPHPLGPEKYMLVMKRPLAPD